MLKMQKYKNMVIYNISYGEYFKKLIHKILPQINYMLYVNWLMSTWQWGQKIVQYTVLDYI